MNPLIIGLGFEQRSGKGELAGLASALGAKHLSFGYALKNECMAWLTEHGVTFHKDNFYGATADRGAILSMPTDVLMDSELSGLAAVTDCMSTVDRTYFTARKLLQYYGTDYRRSQDPEYWRYKAEADMMDAIVGGHQFVVFDDVRFENEAAVVKDNGGIMIRVDRDAASRNGVSEGHASDVGMANYKGWDYIIDNNGTLDQLALQFHSLVYPELTSRNMVSATLKGSV